MTLFATSMSANRRERRPNRTQAFLRQAPDSRWARHTLSESKEDSLDPSESVSTDEGLPLAPDDYDRPVRLALISARLSELYGPRPWSSHGPPLDELVATILSQHTSDLNTARSFASLRETFPAWGDVVAAPTTEVANAIRCGGLAEIKAPRIQAVLRDVDSASGGYSLDWLSDVSLSEARGWLLGLPGVGPKTAACVLLFSLGLPVMPVDTHVFRVSRRLHLINAESTPEAAHDELQELIGADRDATYALHLNLIAHGRTTCGARRPQCAACVLSPFCPSAGRV